MSAHPHPTGSSSKVALAFLAVAVILLAWGSIVGLTMAPPEKFMGDVQRIMYVHVPTAWNGLLAFTFAFISGVAFLVTNSWRWDCRLEAALEVGVLLASMLCMQGAIWAKPTWGVYWDWDPRLTSTAVLVFSFIGILALRRFVDDPAKRATWSSVATIIAFVNVPIVYMSVKWWNSLHQLQSSPETVSAGMVLPLRINAFGMLALLIAFIMFRSRIAALRLRTELAPPLPVPGGAP